MLILRTKVKLFDEEHESELEGAINAFLAKEVHKLIDIKYQISHFSVIPEKTVVQEQIYSFSAMVIYEPKG